MKSSQLEFLWRNAKETLAGNPVEQRTPPVEIAYRRNPLAWRYRLSVDREGTPRVTIPRRGSRREAEEFAAKHTNWIREQVRRHTARRGAIQPWQPGTLVLFRGAQMPIEWITDHPNPCVRLGSEVIPLTSDAAGRPIDLQPIIENHLRRLAEDELPELTFKFAAMHGSPVRRVTIRNQRTRWGSCSGRGTLSLNWRLVQVPVEVRDYIILHELMHLREMNHSRRFWALVFKACPDFKSSEAWLRKNSASLLA